MQNIFDNIQTQVKINHKGTMLAQATVILGNIIETHGWRIMSSTKIHPRFQDMVWVQPPSYRVSGGKWKATVWITDEDLYKAIEDKLYSDYNIAKTNTPPKEDRVSPDDIPF